MDDPRYHTHRWRKTARRILVRDQHTCWVPSCPTVARVADHIRPVYEGMPDGEFFASTNLRASCQRHNLARGHAALLERDTAASSRARRLGSVSSIYVHGAANRTPSSHLFLSGDYTTRRKP